MKHRSRSAKILLGLLCAGGLLLLIFANAEPKYQGKKLSRWLDDINSAGSLSNAEPALQAVREMGTNSLPFLLEIIGERETGLKKRIVDLMERAHLHGFGFVLRRSLKSPACLALKTLGTNAAPIVPHLGELALDQERTGWAVSALFSIGQAAVPGFERACESPLVSTRAGAAIYLCKVVDGSQRGWSWGWNRFNPGGRVVFGVGSAFAGDDDARALRQLLKHSNPAVRRASADALRVHCRSTKVVFQELRSAQMDPVESVRAAANDAIAAIEARAESPE